MKDVTIYYTAADLARYAKKKGLHITEGKIKWDMLKNVLNQIRIPQTKYALRVVPAADAERYLRTFQKKLSK